jgi:hypothetical protein
VTSLPAGRQVCLRGEYLENLMESLREVRKDTTIHKVEGEAIYASRGYEIICSRDGGKSWEVDGWVHAPWWRNNLDSIPLLRRMSRGGVAYVLPQNDGARLCVLAGMIARAEAGSSEYRCVFRFSKGSRPLNLCQDENGSIYWGEYFLNLRRTEPVRIFGSQDRGKSWGVVWTFLQGTICHVHQVVHDPHDHSILVCTGDRDHEVGILKTMDGFHTLRPLVQGNQRFRTTSLIPLPECVLYGTDNPGGENYIMALDRQTGFAKELQKVPGPVLYGSRVGDHTVFATMVEKQYHEASLWCGNGEGFTMVAHFKAEKWNRAVRELMGYPTLILPEGVSHWPDLFFTPVGTKAYSNALLRLNLDRVLETDQSLTV